MIPFNIYIQLWVKSVSVCAWKYCTNLYSELLEIMDTQWGISRSVTSANGLIWAMQSLTAIAVPRTAWNKCPATTSLTRITHPSSPAQQTGREGSVQRDWKNSARKTLVAWEQSHQNLHSHWCVSPSSAMQRCKSCQVGTMTVIFSGNNSETSFGNLG